MRWWGIVLISANWSMIAGEVTVSSRHGDFVFFNIQTSGVSSLTHERIPWFKAMVDNKTNTTWISTTFKVSVQCESAPRVTFATTISNLKPGLRQASESQAYVKDRFTFCDEPTIEIEFAEGRSERDLELEREEWARRAKAAAEEREAQVRAQAAEAERERQRMVQVAKQCRAVYKATADRKMSDLTVRETGQVKACQAVDLYWPK